MISSQIIDKKNITRDDVLHNFFLINRVILHNFAIQLLTKFGYTVTQVSLACFIRKIISVTLLVLFFVVKRRSRAVLSSVLWVCDPNIARSCQTTKLIKRNIYMDYLLRAKSVQLDIDRISVYACLLIEP